MFEMIIFGIIGYLFIGVIVNFIFCMESEVFDEDLSVAIILTWIVTVPLFTIIFGLRALARWTIRIVRRSHEKSVQKRNVS